MPEIDAVAVSPKMSPRPTLKSQQSTSLPATPNQRPRDRASPPRSPSTRRNTSNPSPRAHHSASLPLGRRGHGGCKYETGMANAKRRVAYSLGPDPLDIDPEVLKPYLPSVEDGKLSADMLELYKRLLPSQESEDRRKKLIQKLESILKTRWPGHRITVNVFGSTGNKLGTIDSDVDICITTDCMELENVCLIAETLAQHGMQRVVCISAAKVPIVKIWDPELKLACDMNVNNPVALENTEMIRAYVDIDDRVRPLAMIVKHWAKRRVLNEAALGGTLSSYTWICMIIHFLQTRHPPILPALQQSPSAKRYMCGLDVTFERDATLYHRFGAKNVDSLGVLLFQFFRYYGHEIDYESSVISIRAGKRISKVEKNWHLLQDNRLCVEEPFNTSRNLGNTADDTSFRGIHLELRRAFQMVSEAQLSRCCEEYEHSAHLTDDFRTLERHYPPTARAALAFPQAPGRLPRGNMRPGKHSNGTQPHRLSNNGRRASSASTRGHAYPQILPLGPSTMQNDNALQAQQRQHLLHDQLYIQYQLLQAQEQELRAQLHHQSFLQGRTVTNGQFSPMAFQHSPSVAIPEDLMRARAGIFSQPALTAPIRPQGFALSNISNIYGGRRPAYNSNTNPPSPLLHTILPDSRRNGRRSSMTNGSSGGSLRAHSQPPRPVASPLSFISPADRQRARVGAMSYSRSQEATSSTDDTDDMTYILPVPHRHFYRQPSNDRGNSEYLGYYIGSSPPLPSYSRSASSTPYTQTPGLGIHHANVLPQVLSHVPSQPLSAPLLSSQFIHLPAVNSSRSRANSRVEQPLQDPPRRTNWRSRSNSGPVAVNKFIEHARMNGAHSATRNNAPSTTHVDPRNADEIAIDTSTSSEEPMQGLFDSSEKPEGDTGLEDRTVKRTNSRRKQRSSSTASNGTKEGFITNSTSTANGLPYMTENQPASGGGSAQLGNDQAMETPVKDDKTVRGWLNHLSPVREVRTPPSINGVSSTVNAPTQPAGKKTKGKSKQRKSSMVRVEPNIEKKELLGGQLNGSTLPPSLIRTGGKAAAGSWQTQSKKTKHKSSKSEADLKGLNPSGGEFLPLDESLRKGG